ncbi:FAD-binding oxidoreductase [Kineobactrum sediminis]|uniref:FAD-binding oxidoreductase n=1 Tax=Kineobactrum sediminis TaxID=1905677 RepID=A0A2N5Y2E8_9GAMM|nr:FAD-binding oxidoreductase [Kineobactrum sediminis]
MAHRRELLFWGWGYADQHLLPQEETLLRELVSTVGGGATAVTAPRLDEFALPAPRGKPPAALAGLFSSSVYDRLTHAYGKSFADGVRMLQRAVARPPDWVVFPKNEDQLEMLLEWADISGAALIPFGGGTSVCGGVESAVEGDYSLVVSVDLQYFNRVLEVDPVSRAALIEGGALGPELETALRPHNLTLRHFPQSFQFSTLGGWIATRAGGHYATQYTHIEDFVESIRTLTPSGLMESRRLPGSGAGPSPDRLVVGSEGTLGFITRAWLRVQDRPRFRASASIRFGDMAAACAAVRAISQAALFPSNCRLLDPLEAMLNGVGDGRNAVLVLAFESADHPLDAWLARALELVADHGGRWDADAAERSLHSSETDQNQAQHRQGTAGAWRNQFLRAPYYRNYLTPRGVIADTFETAITWDRFDNFYTGIKDAVSRAIRRETGVDGMLSCRFTHVYPDGPAPYFTFYARGTDSGDMPAMLSRWRQIKLAANTAVTELGGTITHHHAVGRDHRPGGYDQQAPALFRAAFAGAREVLDPRGMMNPGVLIDTPARGATGGGILLS